MRGVNKCFLLGTAGKDPEVKQIGDKTLTKFSLATNRTFKDKTTGEARTETQWHNIEAWGPIAKSMGDWVKKGKPLFIEGEISYNEYEAKDGTKRWSTSIRALEFQLLPDGNKPQAGEKAVSPETATKKVKEYVEESAPTASAANTVSASNADVQGDDEDDLPF